MVEAVFVAPVMTPAARDAFQRMVQSMGAMNSIFGFLSQKETIKMQALSKEWYNKVLPRSGGVTIQMPCLELVLESDRTHIKVGMWRDNIR